MILVSNYCFYYFFVFVSSFVFMPLIEVIEEDLSCPTLSPRDIVNDVVVAPISLVELQNECTLFLKKNSTTQRHEIQVLLFKIAICPRRYVEKLSDKRIEKYCKRYNRIFIYGTGMVARRCTKDFERLHIKIDGYVVSKLRKEELPDNQKVYELSPEIISDKETGIVLAVNSFNAKEIMENPLMKQNKDRVFVYDC